MSDTVKVAKSTSSNEGKGKGNVDNSKRLRGDNTNGKIRKLFYEKLFLDKEGNILTTAKFNKEIKTNDKDNIIKKYLDSYRKDNPNQNQATSNDSNEKYWLRFLKPLKIERKSKELAKLYNIALISDGRQQGEVLGSSNLIDLTIDARDIPRKIQGTIPSLLENGIVFLENEDMENVKKEEVKETKTDKEIIAEEKKMMAENEAIDRANQLPIEEVELETTNKDDLNQLKNQYEVLQKQGKLTETQTKLLEQVNKQLEKPEVTFSREFQARKIMEEEQMKKMEEDRKKMEEEEGKRMEDDTIKLSELDLDEAIIDEVIKENQPPIDPDDPRTLNQGKGRIDDTKLNQDSIGSMSPDPNSKQVTLSLNKQKISKIDTGEPVSTIDQIPKEKLSSDNKTDEQLKEDLTYFFGNFPKPLINLRKFFINMNKLNSQQLLRFHKRVVSILQPSQNNNNGKKVGIVIDAEEYIRKIVGEAMIDKALAEYSLPNLEPINSNNNKDKNTQDIGNYEVKRGPDGLLNSQKEPIYRYIPTTQEQNIEGKQYNYKSSVSRLSLPKSKMRNQVQTGKRQVRQNPFLKVQKGNRINVLL